MFEIFSSLEEIQYQIGVAFGCQMAAFVFGFIIVPWLFDVISIEIAKKVVKNKKRGKNDHEKG